MKELLDFKVMMTQYPPKPGGVKPQDYDILVARVLLALIYKLDEIESRTGGQA